MRRTTYLTLRLEERKKKLKAKKQKKKNVGTELNWNYRLRNRRVTKAESMSALSSLSFSPKNVLRSSKNMHALSCGLSPPSTTQPQAMWQQHTSDVQVQGQHHLSCGFWSILSAACKCMQRIMRLSTRCSVRRCIDSQCENIRFYYYYFFHYYFRHCCNYMDLLIVFICQSVILSIFGCITHERTHLELNKKIWSPIRYEWVGIFKICWQRNRCCRFAEIKLLFNKTSRDWRSICFNYILYWTRSTDELKLFFSVSRLPLRIESSRLSVSVIHWFSLCVSCSGTIKYVQKKLVNKRKFGTLIGRLCSHFETSRVRKIFSIVFCFGNWVESDKKAMNEWEQNWYFMHKIVLQQTFIEFRVIFSVIERIWRNTSTQMERIDREILTSHGEHECDRALLFSQDDRFNHPSACWQLATQRKKQKAI